MITSTRTRSSSVRTTARFRGAAAAATGIALAAALAACGTSAPEPGASDEVQFAALYQEALDAGGKVSLYTHLSGTEEQDRIRTAFEGAYPGITLEVTGLSGQALMERFLTEKRAGVATADVFQYPGAAPFLSGPLIDEGFLEEYTPSEASAYTQEGSFIEGLAYPWSEYQVGACYNPDLLTDEEIELLHHYEGWTDPTWAGRSAIVSPAGGTTLAAWTAWVLEDPDLGEDWLRDLAELKPVVYNSGNPASERVIAGEYAVSFNMNNTTAARVAESGAPYRCTFAEYAVIVPALTSLVADSPNPAGGQLFIEWMLTREGQIALQDATKGVSARDDMADTPPISDDWWEVPSESRSVDVEVISENQESLTNLFAELFGGLGE